MDKRSPLVGIDLGTTNSLVAIVKNGVPIILNSLEGEPLVPSVVHFKNGIPEVGYAAKSQKVRDPAHTVFSVKRLLGRSVQDLSEALEHIPYTLVQGDGIIQIQVEDKKYSAIEISTLILKELKKASEKALGCEVKDAVITVPAYFNDSQRQATRAAGRLAGFHVLRILNEPTAAALAYGLDKKKEGVIAVYDFGGGTFDISILKLHGGIFEVLATNGNTLLGGDDLDQALCSVIVNEISKQARVSAHENPELLVRILESAEKAKIELSQKDKTQIEIELGGGEVYKKILKLAEFEEIIKPILEKTKAPCAHALKDAGVEASSLTDVVMVGGPTRLRAVQKMAQEIFEKIPNTSMHPDQVVAQGAAIQADILAGNNLDLLLIDVVPLSLGMETYGGVMNVLIPRNTRIPMIAKENFTTHVHHQTGVDIHILQGEKERVQDNRSLARFKIGIKPMPAGFPRIEVTFLIDADGILQVTAKDLHTGKEQSIEVRPSYGLSEALIEKMITQGLQNA